MEGPLRNGTIFEAGLVNEICACDRLIDIGPGIRPFDHFRVKTHLCIEPYWEYVRVLSDKGYPVVQADAVTALPLLRNFEVILFLDVIEHMTKADGLLALNLARTMATRQVVVFTPLGFMEQKYEEVDAWGYRGGRWQEHKSGWEPDDFQDWDVYIADGYHGTHSAFAAVLNK